MQGYNTLFCSSEFPWARERFSSSKFTDSLGALKKKKMFAVPDTGEKNA